METDAPLDSATPTLLKEKAIPEDLEAEVEEDCTAVRHQRKVLIRTYPMTLILMRTSFWGHQPIFLFPGDTPMTLSLLSFPQVMMTYECANYTSKSMMMTTTHGLKPMGLGSFEPTSPASRNRSHFNFVCSICINHVLFLNKAAATRSCWRAWGRVSHAAPLSLLNPVI